VSVPSVEPESTNIYSDGEMACLDKEHSVSGRVLAELNVRIRVE
jgi:hypothetical protein